MGCKITVHNNQFIGCTRKLMGELGIDKGRVCVDLMVVWVVGGVAVSWFLSDHVVVVKL